MTTDHNPAEHATPADDSTVVPGAGVALMLPDDEAVIGLKDPDERGRTVIADVAREDAAPGQTVDLDETPTGVVLRRVRGSRTVQDVAALTGTAGAVESFVVDYCVEPYGVPDLVHLAFASPLVGARDALLELFDSIARSVHAVGRPAED